MWPEPKNGSPGRTRTSDLFRVKTPGICTSNYLQVAGDCPIPGKYAEARILLRVKTQARRMELFAMGSVSALIDEGSGSLGIGVARRSRGCATSFTRQTLRS